MIWNALVPPVLALAPENARVIEIYGRALNYVNRSKEALALEGKYHTGSPAWHAAMRAVAKANLELRDFPTVIKNASEILDKFPADPEINLVRVEALAGLGKWEEVLIVGIPAYKFIRPGTYESSQLLKLLRIAYRTRAEASAGP